MPTSCAENLRNSAQWGTWYHARVRREERTLETRLAASQTCTNCAGYGAATSRSGRTPTETVLRVGTNVTHVSPTVADKGEARARKAMASRREHVDFDMRTEGSTAAR